MGVRGWGGCQGGGRGGVGGRRRGGGMGEGFLSRGVKGKSWERWLGAGGGEVIRDRVDKG
jgi:hypothetical protein